MPGPVSAMTTSIVLAAASDDDESAQLAALHHRLGGVQDDVEHDLAHLVGVGQHGRQLRIEVVRDPDAAEHRLVPDERQHVFHDLVHVEERPLRLGLPGEVQEALHDLPASERLVDDRLHVLPPRVIVRHILQHEAAVGEDARSAGC